MLNYTFNYNLACFFSCLTNYYIIFFFFIYTYQHINSKSSGGQSSYDNNNNNNVNDAEFIYLIFRYFFI